MWSRNNIVSHEDTKGGIKNSRSKDRQYNGHKEKKKGTNSDLHFNTQKKIE
jgi:hypothetical protein